MNYSKKGDVMLPCKTFYIFPEYKRLEKHNFVASEESKSHQILSVVFK